MLPLAVPNVTAHQSRAGVPTSYNYRFMYFIREMLTKDCQLRTTDHVYICLNTYRQFIVCCVVWQDSADRSHVLLIIHYDALFALSAAFSLPVARHKIVFLIVCITTYSWQINYVLFSSALKLVNCQHSVINKTSSSAVAKRPRDASCLSVVIFNSTITSSAIFYYY